MASEGAIWYATAVEGSAEVNALAVNKVEFDITPVASKNAYLEEPEFEIIRGDPDNEKVFGNVNEHQDTGVSNIIARIPGVITEPVSSTHQVRENLKSFGIRAQTVDTLYPKGAAGLRCDSVRGSGRCIRYGVQVARHGESHL